MTLLSWDNLLDFNPGDLSEDLKDELGNEFIWLDVENQDETLKLRHMLKISQQILKFKNEQVEALTAEIDNLAVHQGESEVHKRQSLQDEIDQLRVQLSQASRFQNLSKNDGALMLQQEMAKLEAQNEQLLLELQEKEKDFLHEKSETEKHLQQVTTLQKEKNELLRELSIVQKEMNDYGDTKSRLSIPLTPSEKHQDLTDAIRQKNRQITELLDDIQIIENENIVLKDNLSSVRDELDEATKSVSELTNEILNLKSVYEEVKKDLSSKNQEVIDLKTQISELVTEKEIRDVQLDGLITALDTRVKQWQNLLDEKDSELKALKDQLMTYSSDNSQMVGFAQVLRKREEQIEELQKQLKQATYDLEESANLMLKCKLQEATPRSSQSALEKLRMELQFAEEENKLLNQRVKFAELEAHAKAEQVSELIILLREKESGTSAETIIKELQKQKSVRDHHIERLIQAGNQLQEETERLEYENIALRERFSVPKDEVIPIEGVKLCHKEEKLKVAQLEQDLENAQATINSLKIDKRRLKKKLILTSSNQLVHKSVSWSTSSSEIDEKIECKKSTSQILPLPTQKADESTAKSIVDQTLQDKLSELINENESLRGGLHEILDSIQNQKGVSFQIESKSLDRLLEALDARHISGWYHPAMRLQAQLHNLQGVNSGLREQLYKAKEKEMQLLEKLQHCNAFMGQVENYVSTLGHSTSQPEPLQLSAEHKSEHKSEETSVEIPQTLSEEVIKSKGRNDVDESERETLQNKLRRAEKQLEEEKGNFEQLKESLLMKIEDIKSSKMELEAQFNELKFSWDSLQKSPDSLQQQVADLTFRVSSLAGECQRGERKCKALKEFENRTIELKTKTEAELLELKHNFRKEIELLTSEKEELVLNIARLEQLIENSVASSIYEELKNQNFELSVKYDALLNKQPMMISISNSIMDFEVENQKLMAEMEEKFNNKLKYFEKSHRGTDPSSTDQNLKENQQVSVTQAKLLVETQRSEHLTKINQSLKGQLLETETRCQNLQTSLDELEERFFKLELSEASLRDKLFSSVDSDTYNQLQKEHLDLEKRMVFVDSERQRLMAECDLVRMSTSKFVVEHSVMQLKFDSLKRQVLELQSTSDEKLLVGQLMQEAEFVKEKSLKDEAKVEELKLKIQELESTCHEQKIKLCESSNALSTLKDNHLRKRRLFQEIIAGLIVHWVDRIPQPSRECWVKKLDRLTEEKKVAWQQLKSALSANEQRAVELLENQVPLKSNKLKLQNVSLLLMTEKLEKKLELTESRLLKQEELSNRLEEELVTLDKEWENKLHKWSSSLIEMSEFQSEPKPAPEQSIPDKNKEISKNLKVKLNQANSTIQKQSQKMKVLESEVDNLKKKIDILQKQLTEKGNLLFSKANAIRKLESEILDLNETMAKADSNSVETLALKATVDSLQNILNQKEETMRRYQTLLNESREERCSVESLLQREMQNLQDKLSSAQNLINSRSKLAVKNAEDLPVQGYITKVHELEDELAQVNNQVEKLSSQLSVAQQLANQWNNAAADATHINEEFDSKSGSSRIFKEEFSPSTKFLEEKSEEVGKLREELDAMKCRLKEKKETSGKLERVIEDLKQEISSKDQQLSASKAEISRLKHQINIRINSVSSIREEQLKKKTKILEDQLEKYMKQDDEENKIRKERCAKEVEKWQSSKKWQATNDKLRTMLKDTFTQLEASRSTVEKLKELLGKIERDKMILEGRLKTAQAKVNKSALANNLIEQLQKEKKRLEDELVLVRKTFNLTTGATSLVSVIEAQDLKIKSLETCLKSEKSKSMADEVEKLYERQSTLQKLNLSLEERNLELTLQLEALKTEQDVRRQDIFTDTQLVAYQKNQVQIKKLEAELRIMRENYLNAMKQVSDLKTQIRMLELQLSKRSDSDEIKELKAQLIHKNALLSQVKVSLGRAVAKGMCT